MNKALLAQGRVVKPTKPRVLMVNSDLKSNGGIASVVRNLYEVNEIKKNPITIELLKTSYYKDRPRIFELFLLVKSLLKYLYKLVFDNYDLVHIHSSSGISFYRKSLFIILGKLFRKLIILHIHSSNFDDFFVKQGGIRRRYCQTVLGYADLIIVLCDDWMKKLHRHYERLKVLVLPNSIRIEEGKLIQKKESQTLNVLVLAFLIPSKGIRDILELANRLNADRIGNIKIIMGGKGQLQKEVLDRIREDGLSDLIEFKGWVDGERKEELFRRADVYFLPSYKEGMPVSILEAMSKGLPILSTRIAGIPDLVKDGVNGYLTTPGNVTSFCRILKELSADKKKVHSMGVQSLRLAKNFDAMDIFDDLLRIYGKVLQKTTLTMVGPRQ